MPTSSCVEDTAGDSHSQRLWVSCREGAVPHVADVPGTKAAVRHSSAALEASPEKQSGASEEPAMGSLVPHLLGAAVPLGTARLAAPAPAHPAVSPGTERGWQRPSAFLRPAAERLALDLSMSGAEAPDTRDPDAGTRSEDVPSLKEIEQLLNTGRPSCNHVDEVWPNLFLGDLVTAHNRFVLWKMGVTHVLNAAHGTAYSHGGQDFYGATIDYYGVPAHDLPSFDISQFFFSAAQYIHNALKTPGAKILVHCAVGVSRSASLVLAYLMINHHLPLVEAIKTVKEHRWISPNCGFLKHLRNLDVQLRQRKDC